MYSSAGLRGFKLSLHVRERSSNRSGSSVGNTRISARQPCTRALSFDRFLPFWVTGPVLLFEFRRFASICAVVAMAIDSSIHRGSLRVGHVRRFGELRSLCKLGI